MNKWNNLKVGSKVFVDSCGALREYEITEFYIECETKYDSISFIPKIKARYPMREGENWQEHSFTLEQFIKGMESALDKPIREITRN